jgi:hypothetical protein
MVEKLVEKGRGNFLVVIVQLKLIWKCMLVDKPLHGSVVFWKHEVVENGTRW